MKRREKNFRRQHEIPDEIVVLLATTKAAAEGLTFVHAHHVMIMSRHWNPYVEEHALARAARMGQREHVQLYRFIARNSVEKHVSNTGAVKRVKVLGIQNETIMIAAAERASDWTFEDFCQKVCTTYF